MTSKIILSNTFFKLVSFLLQILAKIGILLVIGRSYGVEIFGIFSFALVLNGLFVHICNLGWNSYGVYSIPKGLYKANEIVNRIFPFAFIGTLFSIAAPLLILSVLDHDSEITISVLLLNSSLLFESYILSIRGVFDGNQQMGKSSLITVVSDSILLICVVGLMLVQHSLYAIFVAYILGRFIAFCFAIQLYKKNYGKIEYNLIPDRESIEIFKKALPFAVNRFVTMGYNRFDILLLSYLSGNIFVGIYNAAIVLILRMNSLVKPFIFALFPVLSQQYDKNDASYLNYVERSTKYIVGVAVPIFALFLVVPHKIISLLYGAGFSDSAVILRILSFMIILKFLNPLIGNSVTASGNQVKRTVVVTFSLLLNVFLNLLLIPRYGAVGAAYSSVATETFLTLSLSLVILKNRIRYSVDLGGKLKSAAVLMSVLLLTLLLREVSLLFLIPIVFLATFISYLGLRIIRVDELRYASIICGQATYQK